MTPKYQSRPYRIVESCEKAEDVLLLSTYMWSDHAIDTAMELKKEFPNNTYKVVKTEYTTVYEI